ncbi:hypothetical protein [Xenorhabdus innexi]|uniref:Uncharacterized protein n=1 Tax=Xenorhabdus innexi TaxID=290109 RepID=A0A1N6MYX1_9GAMM|nr:hypothetical protein [Xenorhabdus innexi]PHM31221.1 hypothetical protein Xinn_02930 [Xenorhabdus innexi]SIP74010.1 hypothetical protein XIS1_490007 [Xenorhabdus innexi]
MVELTDTEKYALPSDEKTALNNAIRDFQTKIDNVIFLLYERGIIGNIAKIIILFFVDTFLGNVPSVINQL